MIAQGFDERDTPYRVEYPPSDEQMQAEQPDSVLTWRKAVEMCEIYLPVRGTDGLGMTALFEELKHPSRKFEFDRMHQFSASGFKAALTTKIEAWKASRGYPKKGGDLPRYSKNARTGNYEFFGVRLPDPPPPPGAAGPSG